MSANYNFISFSSISRQKDIVLILYACFKLRKQHQIKPQKRIIIQRNCVFPHKSCIYANQSQEIEKSFGWKRFSDVRRTNGKHILHDLKPSPKRSPNKISSIRKTLFELILFPKTKKQTNSDCDISLTPYPHLSIWFDIKAKQKTGKTPDGLHSAFSPTRENVLAQNKTPSARKYAILVPWIWHSDILINPRTRQNPNGLDLTSAQSRFCQPTGTLFLQKLFQEIIQIFVQPLQQFTVHYHRLIVHKVQVAKRFLVLIHQDERIRLQ